MKWKPRRAQITLSAAFQFVLYEIGIDLATYFISMLSNTQHHFSWTLVHPSRNSFLFFHEARQKKCWSECFLQCRTTMACASQCDTADDKGTQLKRMAKTFFSSFSWIHFLCFHSSIVIGDSGGTLTDRTECWNNHKNKLSRTKRVVRSSRDNSMGNSTGPNRKKN